MGWKQEHTHNHIHQNDHVTVTSQVTDAHQQLPQIGDYDAHTHPSSPHHPITPIAQARACLHDTGGDEVVLLGPALLIPQNDLLLLCNVHPALGLGVRRGKADVAFTSKGGRLSCKRTRIGTTAPTTTTTTTTKVKSQRTR